MKGRKSSGFLLVLLMLLSSSVLAIELSPAQRVIEDTSNEIKLVLSRDRDLLVSDPAYVYQMVDEVLVPRFDMNRISSLVLGKFWRRTSADQKHRFQEEFKHMLIRTYATAFSELNDNWEIKYLQSRAGSNQSLTLVRTQILRQSGPPLSVNYSMKNTGDTWKVYDVKIEGMSLVTNYRSSFRRIMRTSGGIDGLIVHLQESNSQRAVASHASSEIRKVSHSN